MVESKLISTIATECEGNYTRTPSLPNVHPVSLKSYENGRTVPLCKCFQMGDNESGKCKPNEDILNDCILYTVK